MTETRMRLPPRRAAPRVRRLLDLVRYADWLTADRARIYGRLIAVLVGVQAVNLTVRILRSAAADAHWRPEPTDFDTFWAAARLTLQGHAAWAYQPLSMQAAEQLGAQPAAGQFFPYLNPPIFLLLCAPLGLLPYLPSMLAFIAATYAAFVACLRRLLPRAWPSLTVLALPVAMLNGTEGQNGAITAACYAGGALLLERAPVWAGASLGLLAYKPHLGLCVPVVLCAARRWAALASCAGTSLCLALLSWAALGSAPWRGFLAAAGMMHEVIRGDDTWPRMLSTYAAFRILHAGPQAAYAAQAAAALAAACLAARAAAARPGAAAEASLMVAGTLACTPYLLDYDLVCTAVPMAWVAARASAGGWLAWEKCVLGLLYLFPLEARNFNLHLGLPIAPALLGALLWVVAWRARPVATAWAGHPV